MRNVEEGEKFVNSVSVFFFVPYLFLSLSLSFYETMIIQILYIQRMVCCTLMHRRHVPVSKIFLNIVLALDSNKFEID